MTRINTVPVEELSDPHLRAELRELPRVLKQNIDISDTPERYCLGKGHMKWARKHWVFCVNRYKELVAEMQYRGFKVSYTEPPLNNIDTNSYGYYVVTPDDVKLNR
ncbi:MAG: endonuclease, partial [Candidatus Riflebacteria bacterium]|nr:endonuclease [Candidatus Riflebacteria bacterium]